MEIFDNVTKIVRDDLSKTITAGSRLSIAAACFSIYAYEELKEQLEDIESLRFIFTSEAFTTEKARKEKREFYIPRLNRERTLYGSEFEIKLRNELTQKAIAKECADWIRRKVTFRSMCSGQMMNNMVNIEDSSERYTYMPFQGFTTVDMGCSRGNNAMNMITRMETPASDAFIQQFNMIWNNPNMLQDVTDVVIDNITAAYKENAPEYIYFIALYNIFHEFLNDVSEDTLPNEATGFKNSKIWNMLYNFQRDAVLAIISKLEKYNGCILADSVGLGKTFTALAVIKYYEGRNKSVLVLCPKKLSNNWCTYKDNYINNPIAADRLNYDVLYHTDLSRERGQSNGLDLSRLNWGNYDLVVIDESHNFRNGAGGAGHHTSKGENRYEKLMRKVIKEGVKTKVLMLSATPVNNDFSDLRNQLALTYEGVSTNLDETLDTEKTVEQIFRQAGRVFSQWSKLDEQDRTTEKLLRELDFDFFELLDSVTIARSRKHIQQYYNTAEIGTFPTRRKPISERPCLTDLNNAINYQQIYEQLDLLNLDIYTPSAYIFPSKLSKYFDDENPNLGQRGRERGIQRLMNINLLKRLESSVYSFRTTVDRIDALIKNTLSAIERQAAGQHCFIDGTEVPAQNDWDDDDQNDDLILPGKKVRIDLADMDYISWGKSLKADAETLELLSLMICDITPEHDSKLQRILALIDEKVNHPFNAGNKKILIFTAFADTAEYLYANVAPIVLSKYGLHSAMVSGSTDGKTNMPKFKADLNTLLTCFSPRSKDMAVLMPHQKTEIDVLIATDCISEGQNLQDCDYCVNYDIHWNPVRIIQRFGRIDRIGSKNSEIQLVNFWPDVALDDYINLKSRVETRMRISVMTSTGDDDLINAGEKGDLEYRAQQLKRLQQEVVDIEEMQGGISIMDLGLNEFRLDLLDYLKTHKEPHNEPLGLHAVVPHGEETPRGVLFVLKNINNSVNVDNRNRIHPFYMVYISEDSEIICDYLNPKKLLDTLRHLCKGKLAPIEELCSVFNAETKDGRDMQQVSELLSEAINSIMDIKEENDIDSLFRRGGTSALLSQMSGIDDFELICFIVVE